MISNKEISTMIFTLGIDESSLIPNQRLADALKELKQRRECGRFDSELLIIANHYGSIQIIKLVEEMAELTQAIMKDVANNGNGKCEDILQEIADVEILLRQLKLRRKPEYQKKINEIKEYKIKRTLERISKEKER